MVTLGRADIPVARSVWSASSLLAISLIAGGLKAGASSAHSKRFATRDVRTAPQCVAGPMTQSAKTGWPDSALSGLGVYWARTPRVARSSQPWAERCNPFGIVAKGVSIAWLPTHGHGH